MIVDIVKSIFCFYEELIPKRTFRQQHGLKIASKLIRVILNMILCFLVCLVVFSQRCIHDLPEVSVKFSFYHSRRDSALSQWA